MKNILLALLLANILYWMWGMYSGDDAEPGVSIIDETGLGPAQDSAATDEEGVVGTGASLQQVTGRSCVTVGPFRETSDADTALLEYANKGMKTAKRIESANVLIGHWVQIRNVESDSVAKTQLDKLQAGGLTDAYLIKTDDEGLKISLGLFGELDRAKNIESQAKALDLPAETAPRTAQSQVSYVDIALPSGRGAIGIIEQYGEDMVKFRKAAQCP